ncbi:MAG: hypothetical protein EPO68_13265 [Planctomycetota bacterium]|nr:MAG: hypothetical protein EPO68_13265 [Planctomycetota bacterium]
MTGRVEAPHEHAVRAVVPHLHHLARVAAVGLRDLRRPALDVRFERTAAADEREHDQRRGIDVAFRRGQFVLRLAHGVRRLLLDPTRLRAEDERLRRSGRDGGGRCGCGGSGRGGRGRRRGPRLDGAGRGDERECDEREVAMHRVHGPGTIESWP